MQSDGPIIKSHNAPVQYHTIHHSEQNVLISVLNVALWDIGQVHCGICEIGLLFGQLLLAYLKKIGIWNLIACNISV